MEMQVQEIVSLSEICRACLIKTDNMKQLLDTDENILRLITKLSSISNLEIEINDSLPCFLCNNCEQKLQISYDFQQLCQKSHQFILACLSATSVGVKVPNLFKPIQLDDSTVKTELQSEQLESNPNNFITLINNDGQEEKIQVSYQDSEADVPIHDNEQFITLKDARSTVSTDCFGPVDVDEKYIKEYNNDEENFEKPLEVERKTKNNQVMRLPQYSPEEVDKIIKRTRKKFFKHVDCLYCGFTAKDSRALSLHMTRLHKDLKVQWCPWCNQSFENLDEHKQNHHKDDFKCPLCGKYRMNTGHFMEHLASHSIEREYVCKLCEKSFISARHLKMHYAVHTNDKSYSCQFCSKTFMLLKSLSCHLRTHNKHKCIVCEGHFHSAEEYDAHKCFNKRDTEDVAQKDEAKRTPQNYCKECNRKVRSLQSHIDKYHSNIKKDVKDLRALCTYCGKQFRTVGKLTVHVRTHTGEAPYKCSFCDKRMTTRVHLVVHERTHTGEKPHVCKICGKRFAQSSVLNTHMRLHTGRPEQCAICSQRFCRPSELRQHMRRHTGEKPFVCTFCGQAFKQKSHLVEHSKTHSTERPYKCEYCDKSFKQSGTLRSHISIHLGKKPYKCSQCSYACRQSYGLSQHMLQHENDQPNPDKPHRCAMCDRSFTTVAMFTSHYNSQHVTLDTIKDGFVEASAVQGDGIKTAGL